MSMREEIGKVILDYSCYPGEDFYSEGAEEDALLEIVKTKSPKEYNRTIAENSRWSVLYHLSHIRGNIVDFLPIGKTDQVLEVGAGCGAVTGTLSDKAGKVTCIELSKKRSLINAYRNRERDNIEIRVGNFEDVEKELTQKYDYIMLIGVFEYAASYISSQMPYEKFLEILSRHLSKNGKIIIAIENKYGMKYWAGCKEDHVGKYYEGIEGYAHSEGVRTFSKRELSDITRKCGFKSEFFYPYPDYKLPITIFSDRYLPKAGELKDNIRNFDADRVVAFDETLAFNEIIKEGMFPFYSNSYLVSLHKEEKLESFEARKIIYSKHSNERAEAYCIRTDMEENGYGERFVVKTPLTQDVQAHLNKMERYYRKQCEVFENTKLRPNRCKFITKDNSPLNSLEFEFIQGMTLEQELDEIYDQGDTRKVIEKILDYAETLRSLKGMRSFEITPEFTEIFGSVSIPGKQISAEITNLDLIFSNILLKDGWNVIDYEWTFDFPIPVNFVIYRALFYYTQNADKKSLLEQNIYQQAGISKEEISIYKEMEHCFQRYIIGEKFSLVSMHSLMGGHVMNLDRLTNLGGLLRRIQRVKIYYDMGQDFSENNTCYINAETDSLDRVSFDVPLTDGVRAVRIDPVDYPCLLMLHETSTQEALVNGIVMDGKTIVYTTNDPQIVLKNLVPGQGLHIEYTLAALRQDFFENIVHGMEKSQATLFPKKKGPYSKVEMR